METVFHLIWSALGLLGVAMIWVTIPQIKNLSSDRTQADWWKPDGWKPGQ